MAKRIKFAPIKNLKFCNEYSCFTARGDGYGTCVKTGQNISRKSVACEEKK